MDRLSTIFGALSDATRRDIIIRLTKGPATVTDLAAPYDMSLPAVSRHLKVLQQAGFVWQERDAQRRVCHLRRETFGEAIAWLDQHMSDHDESQRAFSGERVPAAKKIGSAA